jgi:hypothetical protein
MKPDYLTDRLGANLHGMLAEYAVLSEEALVHVPNHLSFEEAAGVALRRSDRLGRTDPPSPGYCGRHGPDPRLRGRFGFLRCSSPEPWALA